MKLNSEDKIAISDISDSDGLKILFRQMRFITESIEQRVIQFNSEDVDERKLLIHKARGEGAKMLVSATEKFMDELKKERLGA